MFNLSNLFKLDIKIFKTIYDYCDYVGKGFGFDGAKQGMFILGFVVVGTVLVAINQIGAKQKC